MDKGGTLVGDPDQPDAAVVGGPTPTSSASSVWLVPPKSLTKASSDAWLRLRSSSARRWSKAFRRRLAVSISAISTRRHDGALRE
ncbi:MAG: hypothetical protein EBY61_03500 [Actinobacteria bacterium]|nr:hypothetical protein [Actinomycetota bacterium]